MFVVLLGAAASGAVKVEADALGRSLAFAAQLDAPRRHLFAARRSSTGIAPAR
jgi:hypothetical protein